MKVAFIVSEFPVLSETFILNQITGLLDRGYEVEIFAESNPKEKKIHSDVTKYDLIKRTHYFNIPRNKITRIFKIVYLIIINFYKDPIKILKAINSSLKYRNTKIIFAAISFLRKRFDIIHCHFGPNGVLGIYLKEISIDGELITSFHGYDTSSYPKLRGKNVYNKLFNKCTFFTANSEFTKQQMIKLGCDEKKIDILHEGLRIERFNFFPKKIYSGESIKILTIGRLVEKKGHQYAIRAIAKISEKYKNIEYLIGGEGPLRDKLESLVSDLKIKNYVKFLGAVDQDEVLELYRIAHIFILPSVTASDGDQEGQGLVVQEAQACGLPVISTLHNGIPEGVIDGKTSFLVPERDVDALAERLEYLIQHSEIWPEMGYAGRKFVEEHYNVNRLNEKLVRIYHKLLRSRKER